jgi:predicted nucleotidyltransferase
MILTIDEIKNRITPIAERYKLPAVYLFGSYARGDADEWSDVDILIERQGTNLYNLLRMSGLTMDFEECLSKEIDLLAADIITKSDDHRFADNIMKDAVRIYEG